MKIVQLDLHNSKHEDDFPYLPFSIYKDISQIFP